MRAAERGPCNTRSSTTGAGCLRSAGFTVLGGARRSCGRAGCRTGLTGNSSAVRSANFDAMQVWYVCREHIVSLCPVLRPDLTCCRHLIGIRRSGLLQRGPTGSETK